MTMEEVRMYTDGACEGNPGPGGYAAILDRNGKRTEVTGRERQTTNNRMELLAVIAGLRTLTEPSSVSVVTDSQYVAKGMTTWIHAWRRKGWKTASGSPVKNRDLWEELDALGRRHRLRFEWIRGHNGHPENERADLLAREAIRDPEGV
ncbi:MAG TPA: ribonuclease HI [Vicinamibacteria bacterium]|nr:ribonuclease HI [Vicinamibacteria bacterium]